MNGGPSRSSVTGRPKNNPSVTFDLGADTLAKEMGTGTGPLMKPLFSGPGSEELIAALIQDGGANDPGERQHTLRINPQKLWQYFRDILLEDSGLCRQE